MKKYKNLYFFTLLVGMSIFNIFCERNVWHYIPFDDVMKINLYPKVYDRTTHIFGINGVILYNFFKNLYEKNNLSSLPLHRTPIIPTTIHQIWLGSEVPESFIPFQESWIQHHLGDNWTYKLWTDKDIEEMQLYNKKFYDESDNFGVKSDIARLEIIYRYGGFYSDMDCECLNPLDALLCYDFVIGLQPLDAFFIQINSAFFGARAGHPILKHCIETIKDDWHFKGAPTKTGPVHFTKSFYAAANQNNNCDIALPSFYFCPLGAQDKIANKQEWIKKGAYAVHWWAKSWMPKNYRPAFSQNIHNDKSTVSWND